MQDLLVPLYKLPSVPTEPIGSSITIRPVFPAERHVASQWVREMFSAGWASEFDYAAHRSPVSAYVVIEACKIIGFACFDVAAKGVFGPTGVDEAARGRGIGTALLNRVLQDMRAVGYAYAVIGAAGPVDYYRHAVGAIPIPGGSPGLMKSLLRINRTD